MKKILLVDDDAPFVELMQKALLVFGHEALCAKDARQALQLYDPQTVSLVITDLIMPDMEGVELIMALRRREPSVRIIAMSGGGRNKPDAYLLVAQKLGALKTLAKPFPLETLRMAIKECLDAPPSPGSGR